MRRFFNIALGALAMLAVALLSAFVTMRLAIHGREVEIPNVSGLTVAEASDLASSLGLNINIENHFYSTVTPAGRVLSQYPAPGTKVRREWVMRITESIGPQKVAVPNVVGKSEREASVTIRRLSLVLGTVAYIAAPGPAGMVLSQTPTPAAAGVDGPRISLLVSEPVPVVHLRQAVQETPEDSNLEPDTGMLPPSDADAAASSTSQLASPTPVAPATEGASAQVPPEAYVMPNLVGLTLSVASSRVSAMGLRIGSVDSVRAPIPSVASTAPAASPGQSGQSGIRPIAPVAPITLTNTVISQRPAAGHRVTKADEIHVTLAR